MADSRQIIRVAGLWAEADPLSHNDLHRRWGLAMEVGCKKRRWTEEGLRFPLPAKACQGPVGCAQGPRMGWLGSPLRIIGRYEDAPCAVTAALLLLSL